MAGHDDLAYRLLQQTSYPSWLYSVVNGATTIWERLNSYTREQGFGGNNSMNSFNHYSFGAVGSWMMGRSLGIRRSQGVAGYQRFDLAPTPDPTGQMSWAQGHYDSPFGRIQSRWAVEEEGTRYQFTVPENTQATLYLPATAGATVTGPELDYQQSGERRVYSLAPGNYSFSVKQ
jgi:alpha-L-rhamnosidase